MGLETSFNYIDDLVVTNPNSSPDTLAQADDHLRGIKKAVKGSFPNLGAAAVTKTAAEINDLVDKSTTQTITGAKTFNDFTGTGNLTGNVTGDVTGNVIGNCSGTALSVTGTGVIASTHIAANAIGLSELKTNSTAYGSFTVAAGGNTIVPEGLFFWVADVFITQQIYTGSVWSVAIGSSPSGTVFSDGVNVRFNNATSGTATVRYRRLV